MTENIKLQNNSFDYFRLIAALQVVFGHIVTHLNIEVNRSIAGFISFFPGVVVFFVISGYLISASFDREGGYTYLRSRFLRIYPAMWVAFFVSTITICVLYNIKASVSQTEVWLITQLTVFQYYTPEFLRGYGVGTPNGSLWTIVVELQLYVLIMLCYNKLKTRSMKEWIIIIVTFAFINVLCGLAEGRIPTLLYKFLSVSCIPYLYIMLIGSFIYSKREELLPFLYKYYLVILCIFLFWTTLNKYFVIFPYGKYVNIVQGILLSVVTIAAAYRLGKHKLEFDISYGVYLYHMIVVNAFVALGVGKTYLSMILVFMITIILATLSWFLVEKACLSKRSTIGTVAYNKDGWINETIISNDK